MEALYKRENIAIVLKRTNFIPLKTLFFLFLFSFCPLAILNAWGQDHFVYTNQPLKEVIVDIEARAGYRFLYRDALISDKNISLDAQADSLIPTLQRSLKTHSLDLKVDYSHKQILLSAAQADVVQQPTVVSMQLTIRVTGQVHLVTTSPMEQLTK